MNKIVDVKPLVQYVARKCPLNVCFTVITVAIVTAATTIATAAATELLRSSEAREAKMRLN